MFGFLKKKLDVYAPASGKVIPITEVPDETFASKVIGDGVAIEPTDGNFVAPVSGKITMIFKTNHAYGITTDNDIELIVHIGMDTVELRGEGFTRIAEEGQTVKKGDLIIKADLEFIKSKGFPIVTPVIVSNPENENGVSAKVGETVVGGSDIIMTYAL